MPGRANALPGVEQDSGDVLLAGLGQVFAGGVFRVAHCDPIVFVKGYRHFAVARYSHLTRCRAITVVRRKNRLYGGKRHPSGEATSADGAADGGAVAFGCLRIGDVEIAEIHGV